MRAHGWIIGLIGIWIGLTGVLGLNPELMFWSDFVLGFVLFAISIDLSKSKLIGWILLHLSIWVILMGWIPGFQDGALKPWAHIPTGIVILALGFGSLRISAKYPAYEVEE